jgi:hypothetical protein
VVTGEKEELVREMTVTFPPTADILMNTSKHPLGMHKFDKGFKVGGSEVSDLISLRDVGQFENLLLLLLRGALNLLRR